MTLTIVLWPPAAKHFDRIQGVIHKKYPVVSTKDLSLTKDQFNKFIVGIYKPDKTPGRRVNAKRKAMLKHRLNLRILTVRVDNPTMIPHKKTRLKGKFYCKDMKDLKKSIRGRYKGKVKGYIHDVIIHIGDDEGHNKVVDKLVKRVETTLKTEGHRREG